jgi:hypothetical protein
MIPRTLGLIYVQHYDFIGVPFARPGLTGQQVGFIDNFTIGFNFKHQMGDIYQEAVVLIGQYNRYIWRQSRQYARRYIES